MRKIKSATVIIQSIFFILQFVALLPAQAHVLQSKDAKAHKWFDEKNYTKAALEFKTPAWKGVSWYKAGDYEKAVDQLKDSKEVTSLYNLGNAYAKLGQYPEAIQAYDEVLKKEPEHEDAAYNKKLVLSQMEKNPEKNPESSDQKNQQNNEQGKDKNKENNNEKNKDGSKENKNNDKNDNPSNNEQEDVNNGPEGQPESKQPNDPTSDSKQNDNDSSPEEENNSSNKNESETISKNKQDEIKENQDSQDKNDSQNKSDIKQSKVEDIDKLSSEQENKWLSRIQDDPGGLLRRKFQYQYLASEQEVDEGEPAW